MPNIMFCSEIETASVFDLMFLALWSQYYAQNFFSKVLSSIFIFQIYPRLQVLCNTFM